MNQFFYNELHSIVDRIVPERDGEEVRRLTRMEDELEAQLPPGLRRSFSRLRDQTNAYAAEHGHACFITGLRTGLLLMADARLPGWE